MRCIPGFGRPEKFEDTRTYPFECCVVAGPLLKLKPIYKLLRKVSGKPLKSLWEHDTVVEAGAALLKLCQGPAESGLRRGSFARPIVKAGDIVHRVLKD